MYLFSRSLHCVGTSHFFKWVLWVCSVANFLRVQVWKADVNGNSYNYCQLMHCSPEAAESMSGLSFLVNYVLNVSMC